MAREVRPVRSRVDALRERYRQWRIQRRRWKLLRAYARVARARYGLGPGFTPLIYAYERVLEEGFAEFTSEGFEWRWPEQTPGGDP